jgi:hypothetical protein
LKRIGENAYQATALAFPDCVSVGASRDEALEKAQCEIRARLAEGEVVSVEIDEPRQPATEEEHPWQKIIGIFADDPTYDDFLAEVEAFRRQVDAEEPQQLDASPGH